MLIYRDFSEYRPWAGAIETYDKIKEENKLDELELLLEELYPTGLGETELNDILWFDADWLYEILLIECEEEQNEI